MTIYWVGSPKFTAGHPAPLIALVHHRMVGTLRSTDAAFTSTDGREATTTFETPGEYLVVCNEYCGLGHHLMQGKVIVEAAR